MEKRTSFLLFCSLFIATGNVSAFSHYERSYESSVRVWNRQTKSSNLHAGGRDIFVLAATSRRQLLKDFSVASFGLGSLISLPYGGANASGGATAGGAYLLSAKQRYNERVIAGMKAFLALSSPLEGGSLAEAKEFFSTEEVGGWKDGSAAGYLLSNAFRRNSTTPPDSLPAVKKWKAFQADVEAMQKPIKKKDAKGTLAAFKKAEEKLDAYLEEVELPTVIEMRQ